MHKQETDCNSGFRELNCWVPDSESNCVKPETVAAAIVNLVSQTEVGKLTRGGLKKTAVLRKRVATLAVFCIRYKKKPQTPSSVALKVCKMFAKAFKMLQNALKGHSKGSKYRKNASSHPNTFGI